MVIGSVNVNYSHKYLIEFSREVEGGRATLRSSMSSQQRDSFKLYLHQASQLPATSCASVAELDEEGYRELVAVVDPLFLDLAYLVFPIKMRFKLP